MKNLLLKQAVNDHIKVKIQLLNKKIIELSEVRLEEGKFYGIKTIRGELKKTFFNINKIVNLFRNNDMLIMSYNGVC